MIGFLFFVFLVAYFNGFHLADEFYHFWVLLNRLELFLISLIKYLLILR